MTNRIFPPESWRNRENLLVAGILTFAMVIRVIGIFTRHFDSDEPQHLHVIWGWAHGYVQYRDIFDNHTPLFHIIFSPLFAWLPEWHGVIYVMRFATLPFYLVTLLCTYLIGKTLFSHRSGIWAMVYLALFSRFFFKTIEFRPDSLWTALLTLGIYLMVCRPLTVKSCLLAGVVFGAALSVSFKSVILLTAMGISLPLAWAFTGGLSVSRLKEKLKTTCYGIAGFLAIPTMLILVFYLLNSLPEFYYGVIKHNTLAHGNSAVDYGFIKHKRIAQFLLWMVITGLIARYISAVTENAEIGSKRIFVMATGMSYFAIIFAFWPIVTHQTQLPAFPLLICSLTPFILGDYPLLGGILQRCFKKIQNGLAIPSTLLLVMIAIAQLLILSKGYSMTDGHIDHDQQMWDDVLRYTDRSDYVMDAKGESIFRMRPYFYGFETITMQLVASGTLADNSVESLISKPTYVVVADSYSRYPPKLKRFVQQNYLRVGTLYVAGKRLGDKPPVGLNTPMEFSIALPGRYAITAEGGRLVPGTLNGKHGTGVFDIEDGRQIFIPDVSTPELTVIWDKAWERHIHLS